MSNYVHDDHQRNEPIETTVAVHRQLNELLEVADGDHGVIPTVDLADRDRDLLQELIGA